MRGSPWASPARGARAAGRLLLLAIVCASDSASQESAPDCTPSVLYGRAGELWNASGRLLDYGFAGYRTGEAIPNVAGPVLSVLDFGALPDDGVDDTQAFLDAIAKSSGGVIQIPAGRFLLTQRLEIRKSNLVLRGAGRDRTTLYFPRSLGEVYGLSFNPAGQSNWSFSGGFLTVQGSVGGSLIARVTAPAPRGERTLQVSTTTGLSAGQWVRLLQTDAGGSLLKAIHGGYYDGDVGEDIGRQIFSFLSRIESVGSGSVTLERPLPLEVETAWSPELRMLSASVSEVGIEDLTIEFVGTRYPGHFKENGYNAIYFNGVVDSWVRNVTILNSDYGVNVNGSFFCTVTDLVLATNVDRGPLVGHHGLTSGGGADHLFTRFDVRNTFIHDLSIDNYTLGSVWADGRGVDLNMDHHGRGNYGTLWTRLDLGAGTRPFASGGAAPLRMPHSGARTAFWNVTAARDIGLPRSDFGPLLSFVATKGTEGRPAPADWFVEPLAASAPCQDDLHTAMLERRRRSTRRLSVTKAGTGTGAVTSSPPGISCGAACTAPFAFGSQVTLTAVADSQFDGWSGGGCSGTGSCTVTMDAARSVTATFSWRPTAATVCASGCTRTTIQTALDAATPGDTVLVRSNYDSIAAGEVFPVSTQAVRAINPAGVVRILGEVDGGGSPISAVRTRAAPADGILMLSPGVVENLRILPGDATRVERVITARSGNSCPGPSCNLKGGLALRNLVIDFSSTFNTGNGLDLQADDVLVDKVTLKGIGGTSILVNGDNHTIQNSTLDGRQGGAVRGALGIALGAAAECNTSLKAQSHVIAGNTLTGHAYGIRGCLSGTRIESNAITDFSATAIEALGSLGAQILRNVLTETSTGAQQGMRFVGALYQPGGQRVPTCVGNKIALNKVLGRSARDLAHGIRVADCVDTEVILNEVRDFSSNAIEVSMPTWGLPTRTVIQGNTVIGGNAAGIVYTGADSAGSSEDRSIIRDNVVTDQRRDGIVVQFMKGSRSGVGAGNVVAYNTVRHVNLGGFSDAHGINLQNLSGTAFDRNTALDTQAGYGFFLANSTGVNGNCNTGAANAAGLFGQVNVTPVYGNVNVNCRIALYTHYDFDGDAKSDVAVYRHSTGDWLIRRSSGAGDTSLSWGSPGLDDIPAPANYTQAGKTDVAVYRFSTGDWVIRRSTDGGLTQVKFGEPFVGDIPVPADYDGDGLADLATFRVSTANAEWRIRRSSDGQTQYFAWGCAACADLAVPGDYDGDGKADVAVYRRATGEWFIRRSSNGSLLQLQWGSPELGDLPVAGRYTTSAISDVAVYRSLTGDWLIRRSTDAGLTQVVWGSPSTGDFPVPADYSQANVTDIATFRPSDGLWRIRRSSDFQAINYNFGNPALLDAPLTSR